MSGIRHGKQLLLAVSRLRKPLDVMLKRSNAAMRYWPQNSVLDLIDLAFVKEPRHPVPQNFQKPVFRLMPARRALLGNSRAEAHQLKRHLQ